MKQIMLDCLLGIAMFASLWLFVVLLFSLE
jgi:hypothetical protein